MAVPSLSSRGEMKTKCLAIAWFAIFVAEARKCQELRIPITVAAQNGVFNYQAPSTYQRA